MVAVVKSPFPLRWLVCLLPVLALSATGPGTAWGQESPPAAATATAVAKSKQIRVISDDARVRAAFGLFADELQKGLALILGQNDEAWVFPIHLRVMGSMDDVGSGRSAAIQEITLSADGQFQLELIAWLHTRHDKEETRRELLRLLIYEVMLRPFAGRPDAFSGRELRAPAWLLRGVDELMHHRAQGRPSDLYAGIVRSRQILSVERILGQTEAGLDPVTDAVFSASAAALISALLSQERGAESFRAFLGDLPNAKALDTATVSALLRTHFSGLRGSPEALEKWWSLEIATLGQLQAAEFLSPAQTEEGLDEALAIVMDAETPKPVQGIGKLLPRAKPKAAFTGRVHDFDRFRDHPGATVALEESRRRLQGLALRGFPLYRPLLGRYDQAVSALMEGKERGIAAELKALDAERDSVRLAMERATDYLNYYEATQAEGRSVAYDQYREIREKLERQGRPARNDRITKYLDALEREFATPGR
jgi:hypothetical protein